MKKLVLSIIILIVVIAISSCDYDDSNDIDLLTPNDTTETNGYHAKLDLKN